MSDVIKTVVASVLLALACTTNASQWEVVARSSSNEPPVIATKVADDITGLQEYASVAADSFVSDKGIPNIIPEGAGSSIVAAGARASDTDAPTVIFFPRFIERISPLAYDRRQGITSWIEHIYDSLRGEKSGTDFSLIPIGEFNFGEWVRTNYWNGEIKYYWYTTDADKKWVSCNDGDKSFNLYGKVVKDTDGNHYLRYETPKNKMIYRTCFSVFNTPTNAYGGWAISMTNSLCDVVDMDVQFNPYKAKNISEAPYSGDYTPRMLIWVREMRTGESSSVTNLIVTAQDDHEEMPYDSYPTNYVCDIDSIDAADLCNGMHRLTVKALKLYRSLLGNEAYAFLGYVIYIDGKPVTSCHSPYPVEYYYNVEVSSVYAHYQSENKVFVAMGTGEGTFSCIGFSGAGKIGQIWFEDYDSGMPEFAKDPTYFEVEVGEGVTQYVYDGVTYTTNGLFSVPRGTPSVEITGVMYESGWEAKEGTWYATGNNGKQQVDNEGNASGDIGVFVFALGDKITLTGFKPNYQVGNRYYQTLYGDTGEVGALADAFESGETLKLLSDVFPNEEQNHATIVIEGILTLDLNGYTIYPCYSDSIDVMSGGLTILDSSPDNRGQVKETSDTQYPDFGHPCAIFNDGDLTISSGQFGGIWNYDDTYNPTFTCTISGGQFKNYSSSPSNTFYLADYVAAGHTYTFENRGTASSNDWWVIVSQ